MKKILFRKYYSYLLGHENRILSVETKQGFFIGTPKFLMNVARDRILRTYPFNEEFSENTPELSKLVDIEKIETEPVEKREDSNKNFYKLQHESGTEILLNKELVNLIPLRSLHFKAYSAGGVSSSSPVLVFDSSDDLIAYIAPEPLQ